MKTSHMILLGNSITYVIYDELQGPLTIFFNVMLGFSISEQTDDAFFGMNTSVYRLVAVRQK